MPNSKRQRPKAIFQNHVPAGVQDLMKAYERFQDAYTITTKYLQLTAPKTYQSNSNRSLIIE